MLRVQVRPLTKVIYDSLQKIIYKLLKEIKKDQRERTEDNQSIS